MSLIRCDKCGKAIDTDFDEPFQVMEGGFVDLFCEKCYENEILALPEGAGTIYSENEY